MRDRIGHGYETIDIDIVWNTAKDNIKELDIYCEEILSKWKNKFWAIVLSISLQVYEGKKVKNRQLKILA